MKFTVGRVGSQVRSCRSLNLPFVVKRAFSLSDRKNDLSASYEEKDFLKLVEIDNIDEYFKDLSPFPSYSNILNPQHFFQNEVLSSYLRKEAHAVSLRQLAGYGKTLTKQKIINSANFVRLELPIRLALRIRDLQTLPFGVVNNFHLAQIYESYYHSFNAFRKIPPITTLQDNDKFCDVLSRLLDDHIFNLSHQMMGALEVSILGSLPQEELDQFMSTMLRSRMSRRLIVQEHLSLSENYKKHPYSKKPPDYIGELFDQCSPMEHLRSVEASVKDSMVSLYPNKENMPDLEIEGDTEATFPFISPHLHYIIGEILRNSYEATIKVHQHRTSRKLPPIKVTVVNSKTDILFRFSDQGGGIKHDDLARIWSFGKSAELAMVSLANFHRIPGLQLYSNLKFTQAGSSVVSPSSDKTSNQLFEKTSIGEIDQPSSIKSKKSTLETLITRSNEYKLGLGLPMCKVYADYWHGDLSMNSLEGYGCDTCLSIRKLGYHSNIVQLDRA
ncbi:Piso0_003542 [Millerozyma farinosa CBS 7064]|uniref:Protein-serine/threonine kinase n=1 Tax=Pichia sorbitophila (strain ATCC MYA-4447 / BCRC 22081 / CBS 7064 / NBRC 10061 / NRRL Y-12695) TaxID=559304 RepID=G8YID9_PICSO|nr:Piso0_003542 [Millerozyma farinosa CBS 7064]CCE81191.1 Piso0_003542 [Millerozyma farinosa CBS 7064]